MRKTQEEWVELCLLSGNLFKLKTYQECAKDKKGKREENDTNIYFCSLHKLGLRSDPSNLRDFFTIITQDYSYLDTQIKDFLSLLKDFYN